MNQQKLRWGQSQSRLAGTKSWAKLQVECCQNPAQAICLALNRPKLIFIAADCWDEVSTQTGSEPELDQVGTELGEATRGLTGPDEV